MRHKVHVPIGIDDFRKVRELDLEYVDKSQLILELLDMRGVEVFLLPRPRRFGKTINLSMLRCFFEKQPEDLSRLFQGLRVWEAGEVYRAHFQRYPLIHLTFKGTRHERFEGCWESIREKIQAVFREHQALLSDGTVDEWEASKYRAVLDGTASRTLYERSLLDLSSYLHRRHGERVVLLIDEYDEPIHAGYLNGYTQEIVTFCRTFLTEALKGNPYLFKAVLTGILRVARESIFSGLNNLGVYSLLRSEFNTCFGFTEAEVRGLLERAGRLDRLDLVRDYYNGYVFGGQVIYNPWSVLSYIAGEDGLLRSYWLSTSGNELIRELLEQHAFSVQPEMEILLSGGSFERRLDENIALGDLRTAEGALFSLLVFSGYLRAELPPGQHIEEPPYRLSIPNREVRTVYATTFQQWLAQSLRRRGGDLDVLLSALLAGDAEGLEQQLEAFVENAQSYHDFPVRAPEQVYQAFVVGLLAALEGRHEVRSNREAGRGRADVLVRPREAGRPGAVLELKVVKPSRRRPEKALAEGIAQIREKDYPATLRAAGAAPVHLFAVAFDGKRVWVRGAAERGAAEAKRGLAKRAPAKKRGAPAAKKKAATRERR